jgi:hypothetical protein
VEVPELINYNGHFVACHKVAELGGQQPSIRPQTSAATARVK